MVLGPLTQLVYLLVVPWVNADEYALAVAVEVGRGYQAFAWLALLGALTLAPAAIGVGVVALRGAPLLGMAGLVLAVPALLNPGGDPEDVIYAAVRTGLGPGEGFDLVGRLAELPAGPGSEPAHYLFGVAFHVGGLLLALALWRGRSAPRWAAACLALPALAALAGEFTTLPPQAAVAGWALVLAACTGTAHALVTRSSTTS
jgi:hypothetical protein